MVHRAEAGASGPGGTRSLLRLGLYAVIAALLTGFFLTVSLVPRAFELREGDVSPTNVRAPARVSYVSQVRTRIERERAAASAPPVLDIDVAGAEQQRRQLASLLQSISTVRSTPSLTNDQRVERVSRLGEPPIADVEARWIVLLPDSAWFAVATEAQRLRQDVMKERISDTRLQEVLRELPLRASDQLNDTDRTLAVSIASRFIRPNLLANVEATAQLRRQAQEAVAPVQVTVEEGETVLLQGQVATAQDLEKLEMLGLRNPNADWRSILAGFALAALCTSAVAGYVMVFQPSLIVRERALWLVGLLIILTVLAAKTVLPARPLWVYVFPLPAVAMLLATLLDGRLAMIVTTMLAILVAYVAGGSLEIMVMFTLGGIVASAGSAGIQRLHLYFFVGLGVAAVQALVIVLFRIPSLGDDLQTLSLILVECLINGVLSAVLTVGTVSVLGRLFGITTTMQLLELANPSQPLLRRLLVEAPGTYHHSIMVGNLAERAAEEVGADALLVRVGAYYHDIGKLQRPYFFVENTAQGASAHSGLQPEASARIIASHVPDGLALGHRHGLPRTVMDMIPQHHGTRMVSFFYQQAAEQTGQAPDKSRFSYQGPRPQSKEAAILMLADGVEAATRAMRQHSPEAIGELVERLIMQRLSEGQLDECELTLRDLHRIKAVFCTLLVGVYHPRIEYPESATAVGKSRPLSAGESLEASPPSAH
ncbi:MAG: HD family phosphohydrolase [Chloroflexota bacterium]